MKLLTPTYNFVRCSGLWGRFEDGMTWSKGVKGPKWFLSLGSIFGNAPFDDAVAGLSKWARVMRLEDRMLLAMDAHTDPKAIWNSYHDSQGLYERFIRNGLARSNEILGHSWYRDVDWEVNGRLQEVPLMHRTVVTAVGDVACDPLGMRFAAGDEIHCDGAYKYGPAIMHQIFASAGLREIAQWKAPFSPICKASIPTILKKDVYLVFTFHRRISARPRLECSLKIDEWFDNLIFRPKSLGAADCGFFLEKKNHVVIGGITRHQ